MTTDNWFAAICFLSVYLVGLLLLDGAHRARIGELKQVHREQVQGLRTYIRTLNRERKWLEAELAKEKEAAGGRLLAASQKWEESPFDPFGSRQQPTASSQQPRWLPPSEEYEERD